MFLLVLLIWPIAEIAVFWLIGSLIGFGITIILLVVISLVGLLIFRKVANQHWQGTKTTWRRGLIPGEEIAGGSILSAGLILIAIPGFLSDIVGFLLLIAPVRNFVTERIYPPLPRIFYNKNLFYDVEGKASEEQLVIENNAKEED